MPRRKCRDWITAWLELTENSESPVSYHTWAAISTIAGTLQRRTWMEWGHTTIYPNMYVVLIGPSGSARKGEPIDLSLRFSRQVNLKTINEASTKQAIIRAMKQANSDFQHGSKIKMQCAVTCITEELAVLLGEEDTKFLSYMTAWYDSRDKWTYDTKNMGTDEIIGVCFNLLAASAYDWIPSIIPMTAIGGGFTSRIIFVVEEFKGKTVADPNEVQYPKTLYDDMIADLEHIIMLTGPFTFSDAAKKKYIAWYEEEDDNIRAGNPAIEDSRFSGYVSRRATHLKKVGMICSASHSDKKVITEEDFDRTLKLMLDVEVKMPRTFSRVGKSKFAEQTEMVLAYIVQKKRVSRTDIMRTFYLDVDEWIMQGVEGILTGMGLVRSERDTETRETWYVYRGKPE